MADSVELRMSVASIKRVDPYAKDILAKSTHVALYKFNPASNAWEKTETEGALFLYSRNGEPFHSLMIMNRLNTDNLIEPIIKEFEYQMQTPFLLYKNSKTKIFGIWFYNHEECSSMELLLENVMESIRERNSDKNSHREDVDIFRLLSRAQEDFNKTPNRNDQPKFSTPRAPDVTSQSVMDFFAQASSKSVTKPVNPINVPEVEAHYTMRRLMSNPANTLEHIEKQQRSTTPQEQVVMRKKGTQSAGDRRSVPINFQNSENKENGFNLNCSRISPQHNVTNVTGTSPLTSFIIQKPKDDRDVSSPLAQLLETPQKPALMPPMMFASSSKQEKKEIERLGLDNSINTLVEPLTKNQMIQALTYLLKTDSEFVTKLHEAYVSSLSEMVNHNAPN